jgi:hypothetical protein
MLLRAVPVSDDGGPGLTIGFGEVDFDGFAHPIDLHGHVNVGTPDRMQMSD